mmetsp:Transcript_23308/g.34894  ORF Transcript_23308/g.34894 Transcript_23308/m.34894 type:complete len:1053 (-) Transcript_23308:30-3188(-)
MRAAMQWRTVVVLVCLGRWNGGKWDVEAGNATEGPTFSPQVLTISPTKFPTLRPQTLKPTWRGQTRNPITKGPTVSPTSVSPVTRAPSVSPTTSTPTTIAPSWTATIPFVKTRLPARVPLYDCPDDAIALAYNYDRIEVIAHLTEDIPRNWENATSITSCLALRKHIECQDFPKLCKEYAIKHPFKELESFEVVDGVTIMRGYVFGSHQITVYRDDPSRILVSSGSWVGQPWSVTMNVTYSNNNMLWRGVNSKVWHANKPVRCPPKAKNFANALNLEVPLALYDDVRTQECIEISGDPYCFAGPITATDRAKLHDVCSLSPDHLFCDIPEKWLNDTIIRGRHVYVTTKDHCANTIIRMRLGDGGAIEVTSTAEESMYLWDPFKGMPLSLRNLIEYVSYLASYHEPSPSRAPVPHPPGQQPTSMHEADMWYHCKPVRISLDWCPDFTPVALLNNITHDEVIICTSDAPPRELRPRPIGRGSTCGELRRYTECQMLPGCPLTPNVDVYNVTNGTDFTLPPFTLTIQDGLTYSFDMEARVMSTFSRRFDKMFYAGNPPWVPNTNIWIVESSLSASLKTSNRSLLWTQDWDLKFNTTPSSRHCRLKDLFSYGLSNPPPGNSLPVLSLPHSCLTGLEECFPAPFDSSSRNELADICVSNPGHYWCKVADDWMTKITSSSVRVVNDECRGSSVRLSYGSGNLRDTQKGFPTRTEEEIRNIAAENWMRIEWEDGSEFFQISVRFIPLPDYPPHSDMPTASPTHLPSLSPLPGNDTRSPTVSNSPTSSPTTIDTGYYAPGEHFRKVSVNVVEIAKVLEGIYPTEKKKNPEWWFPLTPFYTYLLIALVSTLLLMCISALLAICGCCKKCRDVCCKCGDSALGKYKKASTNDDDDGDVMEEMMLELDSLPDLKEVPLDDEQNNSVVNGALNGHALPAPKGIPGEGAYRQPGSIEENLLRNTQMNENQKAGEQMTNVDANRIEGDSKQEIGDEKGKRRDIDPDSLPVPDSPPHRAPIDASTLLSALAPSQDADLDKEEQAMNDVIQQINTSGSGWERVHSSKR